MQQQPDRQRGDGEGRAAGAAVAAPGTLIRGRQAEVPGALFELANAAGPIVGRCGGRDAGGASGFGDQDGLSVPQLGHLFFEGTDTLLKVIDQPFELLLKLEQRIGTDDPVDNGARAEPHLQQAGAGQQGIELFVQDGDSFVHITEDYSIEITGDYSIERVHQPFLQDVAGGLFLLLSRLLHRWTV
jgi:hypothetical protein